MLAQPVAYFDALHHHFGDDLAVLTAVLDGAVVAAFVVIRSGDVAYYKLGASAPAAGPVRATDALLWHAIRLAGDWGCSSLDLGLSGLDQQGLLRFKRKYATTTAELVTGRNGLAASSCEPEIRALIDGLTEVLTEPAVPAATLRAAAGHLYRYFS